MFSSVSTIRCQFECHVEYVMKKNILIRKMKIHDFTFDIPQPISHWWWQCQIASIVSGLDTCVHILNRYIYFISCTVRNHLFYLWLTNQFDHFSNIRQNSYFFIFSLLIFHSALIIKKCNREFSCELVKCVER